MLRLRGWGRGPSPLAAGSAVLVSKSLEDPSLGLGKTRHEGGEERSSHPEHCCPQMVANNPSPSGPFLLLTGASVVELVMVQVLIYWPPLWEVQWHLSPFRMECWGLLASALGLSQIQTTGRIRTTSRDCSYQGSSVFSVPDTCASQ